MSWLLVSWITLSVGQRVKALLLRASGSQLEFFLTFKYGKHAQCGILTFFLINLSVGYKKKKKPTTTFSLFLTFVLFFKCQARRRSRVGVERSVYSECCWLGLQYGLRVECLVLFSRCFSAEQKHQTHTGLQAMHAY